MASSKYSDKYFEEILECAVCLNVVQEPYTLNQCFHSYCKHCVDQLLAKQDHVKPGVECPVCRTFSAKEDIRSNYFVNNLVEKHRSCDGGKQSLFCEQCANENPVEAAWKCLDCKMNICQQCQVSHLKIKMLKGHRIIPLTEDTDVYVDQLVFCSVHQDKTIELFCKPCQQPICLKCKATDHDDHKSETVEKALERLVPEIEEGTGHLDEHIDKLGKALGQVDDKIQQVEQGYDYCKAQVDKLAEERIAEIQATQKKLTQTLMKQKEAEKNQLEILKAHVENKQKHMENVRRVMKTSLERARHATLLTELVQGGFIGKVEGLEQGLDEQFGKVEIKIPAIESNANEWGNVVGKGLVGGLVSEVLDFRVGSGMFVSKNVVKSSRYIDVDFKEYFKKDANNTLEFDVGDCYRLAIIDEELWVPHYRANCIKIYSLNAGLLRSVDIGSPVTVERSNVTSHIFITCHSNGGLWMMRQNGNPLKLQDGSFSGLCSYGNAMFALEYQQGIIQEYKHEEHNDKPQWNMYRKIDVNKISQKFYTIDTLVVTENKGAISFYICKYLEGCIHHIDEHGEIIDKGEQTCKGPFLCMINNQSSLLMAERNEDTNKFKILDSNHRSHNIASLKILGNRFHDMVIDSHHCIWTVGGDNKVRKYTI